MSREEVAFVLRAAADLITIGGRTLLVKILRGSEARDIRPEHRSNPAYGVWKDLSQQTVSHRVDWCIKNGFLGVDYFGKLPLLVYPRKGLAIACQTIAAEWYERALRKGLEFLLNRISEVPLNTIMAFLDQVAENGKDQGLPILESFQPKATKRISKRINAILAEWSGSGDRMRCVFDTAWFDESLPFDTAGLFRDFAKGRSILAGDWKFVGQECSGMAEDEIYTALLRDKSACLITTRKAFHNNLHAKRISSFFLDVETWRFLAAPIA
ncbi:MAG: RQC-minor-1 family DNA-binding protein [Verrucomicrobia bacterium]|nr:RQC-minor-1 family DNA-binding protein [Verrucomicrobiota bacterium]